MLRLSLAVLCLVSAAQAMSAVQAAQPLRILVVSGGGYHDYPRQRVLLETELEKRLNVEVSHIFADPPPETKTRPAIPSFRDPDYGRGYDLIIHNECAADESDPAVLDAVLAPHLQGTPALNLHCAMHSFRSGSWRQPVEKGAANARWFAFTGIQSTGHGPQHPITLALTDHPIAKGLTPWVTPHEELYNNLTTYDVQPVMTGTQPDNVPAQWRGPVTVAWTHEYGPRKARVFSLTLAHNESTMEDPRYLDLLARGVAWSTGHLTNAGELDARIQPQK